MTTSKLTLYKGALRILGERTIASLTEDRLPRRLLDLAWDDGAVDYCLEQGEWTFATRTQLLEASTSIEPEFGFRYAFEKSSDWKKTAAICTDEYFTNGARYSDETEIIYADIDRLYVKFISNDPQYGGDYSLWPKTFVEYVEHYLASQISQPLKQKEFDEKKLKKALLEAQNKDLKNKAPKIMPLGILARARLGSGRSYLGLGNYRL